MTSRWYVTLSFSWRTMWTSCRIWTILRKHFAIPNIAWYFWLSTKKATALIECANICFRKTIASSSFVRTLTRWATHLSQNTIDFACFCKIYRIMKCRRDSMKSLKRSICWRMQRSTKLWTSSSKKSFRFLQTKPLLHIRLAIVNNLLLLTVIVCCGITKVLCTTLFATQ